MTQARRKRWSYSAGERGINRVRAYEGRKRYFLLEFTDRGQRERVALGNVDRRVAMQKAEELARRLLEGSEPERQRRAPSLGRLFDNYLREVTPGKSESKQRHDRRTAKLFLELFGDRKRADRLSRKDWDIFIRWRRTRGDLRAGKTLGRPVGNRKVEEDLKFLMAVLNWATVYYEGGEPLFDRNPWKGMPFPREETPRRPTLSNEEFQRMLDLAVGIDPVFELALMVTHETGHRIGAVRLLRWSDVDLERATVHWRGENDKIAFDHTTAITVTAVRALERARTARPSIGDSWIFPAPKDPSKPVSRHLLRDWWTRAEEKAGVSHVPGRGWHSLRRKFATELKDTPLKDLCYLGGWKEPQTVLKCYQSPDEATMRAALARRRTLRIVSAG